MRVLRLLIASSTLWFAACVGGGSNDNSEAQTGGAGGSAGQRASGGTSSGKGGGGGSGGKSVGSGGSGGTTGTGGTRAGSGGIAGSGGSTPQPNADGGAHVIAWVPPYSIGPTKTTLQADFGGVGMKDGLSFLALQFWSANGATSVLEDGVSEDDIAWFRDWGHEHDIRVLLCLHNRFGWNWSVAQSAYRDNRDAMVAHLLTEVDRLNLDGVDLDLEGGGYQPSETDLEEYTAFARALADGLHAKGKVVTVDSYPAQWNAPNWDWWATLLPIVDGINAMGYEEMGQAQYAEQVAHASVAPEKLMIGVPGYVGSWQGASASENLQWILDQGQVGVAIWDAELKDSAWRQADIWQKLSTIRKR